LYEIDLKALGATPLPSEEEKEDDFVPMHEYWCKKCNSRCSSTNFGDDLCYDCQITNPHQPETEKCEHCQGWGCNECQQTGYNKPHQPEKIELPEEIEDMPWGMYEWVKAVTDRLNEGK